MKILSLAASTWTRRECEVRVFMQALLSRGVWQIKQGCRLRRKRLLKSYIQLFLLQLFPRLVLKFIQIVSIMSRLHNFFAASVGPTS